MNGQEKKMEEQEKEKCTRSFAEFVKEAFQTFKKEYDINLNERSNNIASLQQQIDNLHGRVNDMRSRMHDVVQMITIRRRLDFQEKKQFKYVLHNYNSVQKLELSSYNSFKERINEIRMNQLEEYEKEIKAGNKDAAAKKRE